MLRITNSSDFASLFSIPFNPQKIIYSLNSDFFREGNVASKVGQKQLAIDIDDEDLLHNPLPEFPCGESRCRAVFTTVHQYEVHYRSVHSFVCSECKKIFPSYNLLDIHIQERHDTYYETAKEKNLPIFSCIVEGCNELFSSSEMRNEHVIKVHNYPSNFKFQLLKYGKKEAEKMDITSTEELPQNDYFSQSKNRKPVVPRNICFGRGSSRAFSQKNRPKSSPRDISMKELADAL